MTAGLAPGSDLAPAPASAHGPAPAPTLTDAGPWFEGTDGPFRDLTDYILGITHEIWESRQIDRIHDYYSADCVIYTLGGIIRGAATVVRNTHETLQAFPDRLLIGDAVIGSREGYGQFYSSHRIASPMTNQGPSAFGPATGRRVRILTIADCVVENGVITREWLVRDNGGLVEQLGFDPLVVARLQAAVPLQAEHALWLRAAHARARQAPESQGMAIAAVAPTRGSPGTPQAAVDTGAGQFSAAVLRNNWLHGDRDALRRHYAPYALVQDSAPQASGVAAIDAHYAELRRIFGQASLSVDHVCAQPGEGLTSNLAVRWTLAAQHTGAGWGLPATGREVTILGITHWQLVAGRIASEWTILDRIAVLAQLLRPGNG